MWLLIWVCTVCLCPTKRAPDLYGFIFSDLLGLTFVLGAVKYNLIETVLLSSHNICFGWDTRK